MTSYEVVIGLEIHVELATQTKIFCGCKNEFGAEANTLCCPVCTGMPGALPVLNQQVVEYAIAMGHALHCSINTTSKMDRKNYFYPDTPKAYQISQQDIPLCENGYLDICVNGETMRIGVNRIHIEEDAGKLVHGEQQGTLVDYNRCGVPLIEIVSQPDLRSADQAKAYMESIASILQYLGISQVKMQQGNLRADVNVSVRPLGQLTLSTRTEMKNLNSFGAVYRAIQFEAARQIERLKNGGVIQQETRRWDDVKGVSTLLRSKEDTQDYRYFQEPDLLPFTVPQQLIDALKYSLPELPAEKAARYQNEYDLPEYDALLLTAVKPRADFFEKTASLGLCEAKAIANWLLGDIAKWLNENGVELEYTALTPHNLAGMIQLIEKGIISNTAGKAVLEMIIKEDVLPENAVEKLGLLQINDTDVLRAVVQKVLGDNPKAVEEYGKGKTNVLGFLVGQCMKQSKGQANPAVLQEILQAEISKG